VSKSGWPRPRRRISLAFGSLYNVLGVRALISTRMFRASRGRLALTLFATHIVAQWQVLYTYGFYNGSVQGGEPCVDNEPVGTGFWATPTTDSNLYGTAIA
jgi:hypothetical protein